MEWIVWTEPLAFANKVEGPLYQREDVHSLFLGILSQIKEGKYEEYFLATAEENGKVAAVCLMTPPHPLQLIVLDEVPGIEKWIARHLLNLEVEVGAVIGDQAVAWNFADAWTEKKGGAARVFMDQGLYRTDSVNPGLSRSPGAWRVANREDAPRLERWYLLFEEETGIGVSSAVEAGRKIASFIGGKEIYVWEVDGEMVSCMKKSRPSKKGITVSFVFTPKEHRRKGYARTLVAEVTEELLNEYDFAMLYTDLKNPTSNKIYQEIGYEQIANPVHLVIEESLDK
ncbi:GNAT family N-acetyltransferase [Planococcus ruber]|uniref:GNAT family N-acetyltransferase n=1 Tax=Planococcus ruber TaxID=2027871 RepID=UPI001FF06672|nr:GNAT family N-acetyltransferase [Planococcus ruber]MCJ1909484.1 GNAT family N-acetyltransferase [Planococcus ruber]